ncbi:MAG TPA: hypothetical protein VG454_10545, partial [Gemmatimonadales bacterium]|nr:hypothetical protein [Gemmatimonadales bacterium]
RQHPRDGERMKDLTIARTAGLSATALLLAAGLPACLPAQVALHAAVGARFSSALVHDSIVAPVDAKPAIGPSLALAISQRTNGPWIPDANLDVSWASLQRQESGTTTKFNSITGIAFTVGVSREVRHGLFARAGFGGIKYLPSDETGMFRGGSGLWANGTASLYWIPATLGGPAHDIGVLLRYDVHKFSTPALHAEGFTSSQWVHRISLGIGARILGKAGPP